jgi:Domain of unknown function (DUF222)
MGWQPDQEDDGSAEPGTVRDPRLPGFAKDGEWDVCRPSAALVTALEGVSGPEWHCPGATRDELLGLLRQAQAIESWATAAKCGILRSLIRDDDQPFPGGGYHGDLPEGWTKSLTHEVALALSMPAVSADKLMWGAWDLQARIRGTEDLLAAGALTYAKAKAVHEAFLLLSDEDAAEAEAMILTELPGKTYGQVKRLAEQAAMTVDPDAAGRRRRDAEQNKSRVEMFREDSGAAALSGRDLPTDQALAAHAHVCARAQQYKDSGAFPDDARMDQFRAAAYLDLLNGKSAEERIAAGQVATVTPTADTEAGTTETADARESHGDNVVVPASGVPGSTDNSGHDRQGEEQADDDSPDEGDLGTGAQRDQGPSGPPGSPGGSGSANVTPPRLVDLVLPLVTLLGLTERPGESHGLGPLDPDLCRALAAAATRSPWTRLCVTVTDPEGIAIGHGCAKPPRNARTRIPGQAEQPASPLPGTRTGLALPAQVNLTITAALLTELAAAGPPATSDESRPLGEPPWSFIRASDSGPPDGRGTWTLTLPDGKSLTVALEPMPTFECDHRHESRAYQPNDRLRHLVQVRDYTCTFPPCNRHARESDFEHAVPYDKGGKTCACNAGARSRACHQVKQSPNWQVTQTRPGWHQWTTPAGRIYTQTPKRYPT